MAAVDRAALWDRGVDNGVECCKPLSLSVDADKPAEWLFSRDGILFYYRNDGFSEALVWDSYCYRE